ncbi:MAG: cytochrome c oxidase subunit II [Chloroflexota bacterium]|nr:cytochrome c oxidase subunit II [Chloroflexota bacterium]
MRRFLAVPASLLLFGGTAATSAAQSWVASPASPQAELISQLFWFTLILAVIVFVLVEGLLIYSSLRFRRRAPLPMYEPPQIHGNTRLEVMWAAVPALILVGLFGITVTRLGDLSQLPTNDPNALRIAVTGRQFSWEFGYGDTGVKSTNMLRIPVGRPLLFEVTSADVIHSFWVPDMYGKIDANPGRVNRISFEARQEGSFRGVCAELCGAGHGGMLFRVEAMAPSDWQQWIEQQQSGAPPAPAPGGGGPDQVAEGRQLISAKGCGGCHNVPGVAGAAGTVGPSLAGVASRRTIAGGAVPHNSPDDLKRWIMDPPALKPGTAMPKLGLTEDEATKLVAFLETLK